MEKSEKPPGAEIVPDLDSNGTTSDEIDIAPGDLVAVRPKCRKFKTGPNTLCDIGLPNEFEVLERGTLKDKVTGELFDCITLWPCCMRLRNPASGQFICTGHNVEHFEKIEVPESDDEKPGKNPDGFLSFKTPFGEMFGYSYWSDEGRLMLRGPGKQNAVEVQGELAKILGGLFRGGIV